ncbi:nodulation protein NolB [Rhizobium leguminosarum]|uniref:nodulation protein NolB n=1 Tax=Rhizobium leguminosarum TaxID=384 RepID=UPI0013B5C24B|nr:nodulation protein NolB [Rhizobium leguminosarum]NEI67604.1 nodulation protein NolB [Rhizobium leguminosarum]
MMLCVTSISTNLTDGLSKAGSAAVVGEHALFQRSLVQAANSIKNDASFATAGVPSVPPTSEVHRAVTQTNPVGDRVLQALSSMHRHNVVAPPALGGEVTLVTGALPGPAAQLPLQTRPEGVQTPGALQGGRDFETMLAGLRDVYNYATRVSLVCKGIGSASSSVNKLLSAG